MSMEFKPAAYQKKACENETEMVIHISLTIRRAMKLLVTNSQTQKKMARFERAILNSPLEFYGSIYQPL